MFELWRYLFVRSATHSLTGKPILYSKPKRTDVGRSLRIRWRARRIDRTQTDPSGEEVIVLSGVTPSMERTQNERCLRDCDVAESNDWRTIAGGLRDTQMRNKYSRETMMV